MEFERALYRVHDRTLSVLVARHEPSLRLLARSLGLLSFAGLVLLMSLHVSYVGEGSCLVAALQRDHGLLASVVPPPNASGSNRTSLFADDMLLVRAFPLNSDGGSFIADYEFSPSAALLGLEPQLRSRHAISTFNVTLPVSCIGGGSLWHNFVRGLGLHDAIVINQLMHGLESDGFVRNMRTKELWGWEESSFHRGGFGVWVNQKLSVVLVSCFAFFAVSAVTALLVRILVSSGVVLMFPLFYALRNLGLVRVSERLLSLSYPWLGAQVERLQLERRPLGPFVAAHLSLVFVMYMMYEACQAVFAVWIYDKAIPSGLPLWIYGLMMLWEYYTLIFVRSKLGIRFFPRFVALQFLAFHMYFFSTQYGFFAVAALTLWISAAHVMLHFLIYHELPAVQLGTVSMDHPRSMYTLLPAMRLRSDHSLAPLWSMFHTINAVHLSVYETGNISTTASGPSGLAREQSMEEGRVRHSPLPPGSVPTIAVRGISPRSDAEDVEDGEGVVVGRDEAEWGGFLGRLRTAVRDAAGPDSARYTRYSRLRAADDGEP